MDSEDGGWLHLIHAISSTNTFNRYYSEFVTGKKHLF